MGCFKAAAALLVVAILIGTLLPSLAASPLPRDIREKCMLVRSFQNAQRVRWECRWEHLPSKGRLLAAASTPLVSRGVRARRLTGGRGRSATGVPVYAERRGSDSAGASTGAGEMTDRGVRETTTRGPSAASETAANETVPAEVRVGSVVLLGSLAQPSSVSFDSARCMSVPEVGGTTNGSAVDALVWWDVFSNRPVCNAVQLFESPDCSGTAAEEHLYNLYMSVTKVNPSVKSIRCVLDNICGRVKCPEHSTCINTNDRLEVACQCDQGYRAVYGQCQPQ
ncbi:unnamed protein product [Closterium sp. NIES-65]|nr:unnamed protein product [Closterium sp. NIES-65]